MLMQGIGFILQAWKLATIQEAVNLNRKLEREGRTWAEVARWLKEKEAQEQRMVELSLEELSLLRARSRGKIRRLPKALRKKLWAMEGWDLENRKLSRCKP